MVQRWCGNSGSHFPQPLSFASTLVADAGAYHFVASNAINVVTSRVAHLVCPAGHASTGAPLRRLLDATHVLAAFSEPLLGSGVTNLALYSVTNTFGATANVLTAVLTNGTNVLLTTSPLASDANYILTAADVPDGSLQQNLLPLTAVPVARPAYAAAVWRVLGCTSIPIRPSTKLIRTGLEGTGF
jgi:hypothetical protein